MCEPCESYSYYFCISLPFTRMNFGHFFSDGSSAEPVLWGQDESPLPLPED